MLAAALSLCLTAPGSKPAEIELPRDYTLTRVHAIGPRGELAIEAEKDGIPRPFILRNGKLHEIVTPDAALFRYSEDGPVFYNIEGFLPDGEVFGGGLCGTSGATLVSGSRAFITRRGRAELVELPEEYKEWAHSTVKAVRLDGAILLQLNSQWMFGLDNPEAFADHLVWVRDGKVIQKLGPASNPIIGPNGEMVATQYTDWHGTLTGPSLGPNRGYVAVWENGEIKRVIEGSPVGFLPDGSLAVLNFVPDNPNADPDTVYSNPPGTYTLKRLANGVVGEVVIKGAPEPVTGVTCYNPGYWAYWTARKDDPRGTVRATNGRRFVDITSLLNDPIDNLVLMGKGIMVFESYDSEAGRARFYTAPLPF